MVGILVIAWVLFVFVISDVLILGPLPGKFDAGTAHREMVGAAGRKIEVWVARSPALGPDETPTGYVLELPGHTTRAEQIAQYVAQRWHRWPVEAWVVNYPGVGGSNGWPRLASVGPASLAVYDEIRHRAGPNTPIFVEANSLGTAAGLCVAARRPVAGCVLHDPVPLKQLILAKYGWWNLWLVAGPVAWHIPTDLDSLSNAPRVKSPAVFIFADGDDYVPPDLQHRVVDLYAGPSRKVVLHGGHWSSVEGNTADELERAIGWLWDGK